MLLATQKEWLLFTWHTSQSGSKIGKCRSTCSKVCGVESTRSGPNWTSHGPPGGRGFKAGDIHIRNWRPKLTHRIRAEAAEQSTDNSAATSSKTMAITKSPVMRRDWEDPQVVNRNTRRAHVPLHSHPSVEGAVDILLMLELRAF
jgi:hypothetical protein